MKVPWSKNESFWERVPRKTNESKEVKVSSEVNESGFFKSTKEREWIIPFESTHHDRDSFRSVGTH